MIINGICKDFAKFISNVCHDVGIKCEILYGITPNAHAWNLIEIDGIKKHYDISYALFVVDKYANWDKKAKFEDFLGASTEKLKKLQPLRSILTQNIEKI